jgi:hypothetical protein
MAIKRYKDWRQFYIIFEDGREEPYGKPRLISVPKKTKAWKELRQIAGNDDVQAVGWRTVKNPNS